MSNDGSSHGTRGQEELASGRLQNDFFYHGRIVRLAPKKKYGIVRTSSGKDLRFSYELVDMYGPVRDPRGLREGLVVGYDMSWTSSGLVVTKIKTYRRAQPPSSVEETRPAEAAAEKAVDSSDGEER